MFPDYLVIVMKLIGYLRDTVNGFNSDHYEKF